MDEKTGPRAHVVWDPLCNAESDRRRAANMPSTPQTRAAAYRLAFTDEDFIGRQDLRPVRLQLELLKPELHLNERGIASTVVMFGGARIPEPGGEARAARNETQRRNLTGAARYYDEARAFARLCSRHSAATGHREFVVVTGGGPGVMEAGNRGAADESAPSIGLSIVLPHEITPNAYVTPDLCFNFHYFALRKMHFLLRARAVTVFPGGFGTLDELFESLTLMQTGRMQRIPLILFGAQFWRKVIDFQELADFGTIAPDDLDLIRFVETAGEAWAIVAEHYGL